MEVRRNSRTIFKSMYNRQKRVLALLLTAAMIFTNVGTGLDVSYAGTADQITFQIKGADLVSAVEEAILSGRSITEDDLDFTNGKTAEFEKVFFDGESGAVYEVYPEMEGGSMETELRVFVRLPEDVDDMYMVTGDEEIILLYVNNGDDTISCNTEVIRMDDGVEKVKKTKRVTVRSYEDAFGDEEVDIISRPVEETKDAGTENPETTVPEEGASQAETTAPEGNGSQTETTDSEENGSQTETTVPEEGGSQAETTAPESGSDAGTTATKADDAANGSSIAGDAANDAANGSSSAGEAADGADHAAGAADETKADVSGDHDSEDSRAEEKKESDHKSEISDAKNEKEDKEVSEEKSEISEPVASISRHSAPVVTEKEEDQAEAAEAGKETEAQEKEETKKETEVREKEETAKETEIQEKEETGKETADAVKDETENAAAGSEDVSKETADREDATESIKDNTVDDMTDHTADHTTATDDETVEPGTDENGSAPATSEGNAADHTDHTEETSSESGTAAGTDVNPSTEPEQGTTEAEKPEDNVNKAGNSDLAGMGYCSTVKVYTTTLNKLKALEDFDGYQVIYTSYPDASARILEGARGVMDGETLTFGVKTQMGYSIDNVTVNDEIIEAETMENHEDGSQTAWYTVPEVYEEQKVEVYTLETMEHPAFDKSVEVNGVTIRVTAPEGVLPLDTEIQAEEITEQVASAVTEKVTAESGDETAVSQVIAYDINLTYNGLKLDNSWADNENNYVTVSFSGDRIAKASKEADQIEILHVETPTEVVEAVSAKAELEGSIETDAVAEVPVLDNLTAENISVDSEGRQELDVSGDASVGQIDFQTDHFSAFTVVFKSSPRLVISNKLEEGSKGMEKVTYPYTVTIIGSNGEEKFFLGDIDNDKFTPDETDEFTKIEKQYEVIEGKNTAVYTFDLNPDSQLIITNISRDAEYKVTQESVPHNTFNGTKTVKTGVDWAQVEDGSEQETPPENDVPDYGYKSEQGAYSSLVERAAALSNAFSKCWEVDKQSTSNATRFRERSALLDNTTKYGSWNDQLRSKLLRDHYGQDTEWPLAVNEGFGDVIKEAQDLMEQTDVRESQRVDLYNSRLNIYFQGVDNSSLDPGEIEMVPYLTSNITWQRWKAYVAYNSADGGNWYQYRLKTSNGYQIGNFEPRLVSANDIITGNDAWKLLMPANLAEPEYEEGPEHVVEGSFVTAGFVRQISITFNNYYYNIENNEGTGGEITDPPIEKPTEKPDGGSTDTPTENQPGGSTDNPTENQPGGSTDNPTENQPGGSTDNPTENQPGGSTDTPTENQPGGSTDNPTESQPGGSTDNPTENQPGSSTDTSTGNPSDGSTGGGGNSGGGGSAAVTGNGQYQGSAAQNGPGVTQSMIEPSEVPLAALPTDASAASQAIAIIDDGEIPMAAIPKTGNRGSNARELSFILSGVLLAVYTALAKKKKTS